MHCSQMGGVYLLALSAAASWTNVDLSEDFVPGNALLQKHAERQDPLIQHAYLLTTPSPVGEARLAALKERAEWKDTSQGEVVKGVNAHLLGRTETEIAPKILTAEQQELWKLNPNSTEGPQDAGSVACALGHYWMYQRALESWNKNSHGRWALFFEDDVGRFTPDSLRYMLEQAPAEADMVFLESRQCLVLSHQIAHNFTPYTEDAQGVLRCDCGCDFSGCFDSLSCCMGTGSSAYALTRKGVEIAMKSAFRFNADILLMQLAIKGRLKGYCPGYKDKILYDETRPSDIHAPQ